MQALALCQKTCPDKIPFIPVDKLGDGADGDVYGLEHDPNKVIKFCVLYERYPGDDIKKTYKNIDRVLLYLEKYKPHVCARVYMHKFLSHGIRKTTEGEQKYLLYYYIMQKLFKISDDEKKVFHSILSHEDMGINKEFTLDLVQDMLIGMSKGLEFDINSVLSFYDDIRKVKIKHLDLHVRNIMKDQFGNFKLIDFDRAKIGE
jgi:hypothetical protein